MIYFKKIKLICVCVCVCVCVCLFFINLVYILKKFIVVDEYENSTIIKRIVEIRYYLIFFQFVN